MVDEQDNHEELSTLSLLAHVTLQYLSRQEQASTRY